MTYGVVPSLWNPLLLKGGLRWRGNAFLASFVLDTFTTFPVVAYSVRQLTGGLYNVPYCMLVRRSSDNATLNIGYANGILNTAALLAFVGSSNGYVVTWYNQGSFGSSGDATQSTAANQPQIVANGVVTTSTNGLHALVFAGSQYLVTSGSIPISGTSTGYLNAVVSTTQIISQAIALSFGAQSTGQSRIIGVVSSHYLVDSYNQPVESGTPTTNTSFILSGLWKSSNPTQSLIVNGSTLSTNTSTINTTSAPLYVGMRLGISQYWQGNEQEVIIYTNQNDQLILEPNQGLVFGINGVTQ